MLQERGIEGVRVLLGLSSLAKKHSHGSLEKACELAISHGAWRLQSLRQLMREPTRQSEFIEVHPLIRPMEVYGRYFKASFGKEDNNGELIALTAPRGEKKGKSPDGPQALSQAAAYRSGAVQPPVTALPCAALSSEPAPEKVAPKPPPVNVFLERTTL
jgi:hypothetical protein